MPPKNFEFRLSIFDCKEENKMPDVVGNRHPARVVSLPVYCETGTAKYAVNAPVFGSAALPVISPLLLMSRATASILEKPGALRSFRSVGVLPRSQMTARQSTKSASHET